MTQIKKAFILLIAGFVIIAGYTPLQAAQKTDGHYFIMHEVLGGGILPAEKVTDITGTLGQSLAIIGKSENDLYTNIDTEQLAGFWYAINSQVDLPVVSFMMGDINVQNETGGPFDIKIGLNQTTGNSLTVTVDITTSSSSCDYTDYTISNGFVQNTKTMTVVIDNDYNDDISISINDDNMIEENEVIQLKIVDVQGDAVIGSLNTLSLNILANDAFPITGAVKYLGSQTGTLNIKAENLDTGQTFVDNEVWNSQTIIADYSFIVAPGDYSITAFIDSATGTVGYNESWEACGSYTFVVAHTESDINFFIDDPENRYKDQYSEETDTYKDWIANYPNIGGPGADYDNDGYSNFQEYINGTDPTQDDAAYVFDGYDPGTDNRTSTLTKPYQIISTNPLKPQTQMGEDAYFLVDVNYTTSDYNNAFTVNSNNAGTTGLGLVIHFNSNAIELAGVYNPLTDSLQNEISKLTRVEDEGEDYNDLFDDTDKVVKISWLNTNNVWPVEKRLPIILCTLKFKVKANLEGLQYGDTSVIRFSAQDMDIRYNFYASPSIVEFNEFNFDIDGNGYVDALTDGIQIVRYMFDLIDEEDTSVATDIGVNATRTTYLQLYDFIHNGRLCLDIDKNGEAKAQSDGLMLLRYMFEVFTSESLIENAVGVGALNTTADTIIPYIEQYMPRKGSDKLSP